MKLILLILFLTCLIKVSAQSLYVGNATFINAGFAAPPFTSYKQVVINDRASDLYLMDTLGGTQITDYAGPNNIPFPAGLATNRPGVLAGSTTTASSIATSAILATGSTLGNFDYTNSFTYEFIFVNSNAATAGGQYNLAAKFKYAAPYNGYQFALDYDNQLSYVAWDGTTLPNNWYFPFFYMADPSGDAYLIQGFCNIKYGTTNMLDLVYQWTTNQFYPNGTPFVSFYLNGNSVPTTSNTWNGVFSPIATATNVTLFNTYNNAGPFVGLVQAVSVYPTNLNETQILTHWLAYNQAQTYQPGSYLYSSYKGVDQTGTNLLRISDPGILWVASSNLYYIYGYPSSGTNINVFNGPADQLGPTRVPVYSSPNLTPGSFTYLGTALDCSTLANTPNVVRPQVVLNKNSSTPYYVMWVKVLTNYIVGPAFNVADIATSTVPQGPFTLVATNYLPQGHNMGDEALLVDTNGTGYVAFALYPQIGVSALNSSYTATAGSLDTIGNVGAVEGLGFNKIGTNYFLIYGSEQYYQMVNQLDTYWASSSNPLGTWFTNTSIFTTSPYASGLDGQSGNGFFQDAQDGKWIESFDNWHNGDLSHSTVIFQQVNVNNATNISITPSKLIHL